jgi:NAD-dependent dihydropyrimidine dehydrogenase PreA subunit
MKVKRKIIEINEELCDGCGQCVPACAEGALQIVDGTVKLVSEVYCDGLGACLKDCPNGAIEIIEREAEEFDEKAVEAYLEEKKHSEKVTDVSLPCGCPSNQVKVFQPSCHESKHQGTHASTSSALSHWPVQIRLVPPTAPFLNGADILVAADCTPIAYPDFHQEFLKGRVVLIGCPKFDNPQEYIKKFADIFRESDIRSVTVLDMEVPCCSALPAIVNKGMQISGKRIPIEEVVISTQGHILREHEYKS